MKNTIVVLPDSTMTIEEIEKYITGLVDYLNSGEKITKLKNNGVQKE